MLTLVGCQGDQAPQTPSPSVEAFPDPPQVAGPLRVELRPALREMRDAESYRPLGAPRAAVVDEVGTAPSADHTSWQTTVRFTTGSRVVMRQVREEAAGLGGVVLVTVGDTVVMVATPPEISPGRIVRLGLEKAEAWSLVDAFE
ncbi:hypothetical protein [Nocardioides hankookensis]|uniref:Uncharacterized protein n=1 Tax=Nocardioides hankookensis TaxID=443157 RepID=A0ABW1LEV0_9ACTN